MSDLYLGDCREIRTALPDNSVDTIITDPPYGLEFMGKGWDKGVPGVEFWKEFLAVAKPGAMLLAFGGTRTFHRMTCAIEDAGWEIRDCLMWLYGSGFPKSLDISKAIDKAKGAARTDVIGRRWEENRKPGTKESGIYGELAPDNGLITAPATDLAREWSGWGTALKPAWEPIILAMKPLDGTFAENAEKWGVAGINVDGGRIEGSKANGSGIASTFVARHHKDRVFDLSKGRWPANLLLDEDAAAMLDGQSGGQMHSAGKARGAIREAEPTGMFGMPGDGQRFGDSGGASRFFYVAKASKSERNAGCEEVMTWEGQDQSSLTVGIAAHAAAISDGTITALSKWSTESYGNRVSEKYLKDLIFTISTVSKLITALRTCDLSQSSTINGYIRAALNSLTAGRNLAENVEFIETLKLPTTDESMELARGASLVVLKMLSAISDSANRGNCHSTVKPLKLMEYLCTLTKTPTGGIVLDPFAGSGTTLLAAKNTGREYIGIEQNPEYFEIVKARLGLA